MRVVRRRAAAVLITAVVSAMGPLMAQAQVAPAAASPTTQTSTGPASRPSTFAFRFQDAPTSTVLDYLSKTAGLTVILIQVNVSGRVTILNDDMVTTDRAIELLNTVLKEQSLAAILQGSVLKVESLD